MISIQNYTDHVVVSGHAGVAPRGFSVPCEAVTVLVNNVVVSIEALTEDEPEYTMESGYFYLTKKGLTAESGLLVRSFLVGLEMVAEAYPAYTGINLIGNSNIRYIIKRRPTGRLFEYDGNAVDLW